jgi:hypothetical protein
MAANNVRIQATVLGKSGYGKSHFIKHYIIPRLVSQGKPVLIVDTMNEYESGHAHNGFRSFVSEVRRSGRIRAGINVVKCKSDADCYALFEFVRRLELPVSFIIEEADKFCNPYQIDPNLKALINYGRHWGVDMIFVARRMAALNRDVTAQSDFIVTFAQTEKNDLVGLSNYTDNPEAVKALSKRQFLAFGDYPDLYLDLLQGRSMTLNPSNKPISA